ncbi:MAG: lysozyme [Cyanobacteria bacterium P01_G01_bin.67]
MNKYIDGTIVLISVCSLGLTTISIAESKISEPSNDIVKDLQLQRLDDSLAINLRNAETIIPPEEIEPQQQPVSEIAVNLIKEFEGFKDYAYIDTDGTPVIGYGLSRIAGKPVSIGDRIDQTQAHAALMEHLEEIHRELDPVLKVNLNEQQLSALASISFNVGVNSIKNSTLLRKINAEDYAGAANEFLRWDKANLRGRLVQMPGLARRRQAERKLFLEQSS